MKYWKVSTDCLVMEGTVDWVVEAETEEQAWAKGYDLAMKSNVADSGSVEVVGELVMKKTPVQPIRVKVKGSGKDETDGCPICKREFFEKFHFCPDCGVELDWE